LNSQTMYRRLVSKFSYSPRKIAVIPHLNKRAFTRTLRERMKELVPKEQERVKALLAKHGDKEISKVTVKQVIQGTRGVKALICETSALDEYEGIRFRGLSVPEVQERLPKPSCRGLEGEYVLPEGLLWLLMTGEIPTADETRQLSEELTSEPRCSIPKHVRQLIDNLPTHQHPMAQFAAGILALQSDSQFAKAYEDGVNKSQYWEYALEDALTLIARLPSLSSRIYRHCFRDGMMIKHEKDLDWAANWCHMSGFDSAEIYDLMRMYFTIHIDHEGGNVSAHVCHLVGSALSDPYLSFTAGLCGLAGPLHGLANQESLRFIKKVQRKLGGNKPSKKFIEDFVVDLLTSGQVVPGFGHAVLRKTDPRYMIQRDFALKYMSNDEVFQIVSLLFEVVPDILKNWKGGKVANPWPNLDAHSGCLLQHYGLVEDHFYTVLFGMGRALGVMSQYVVSRALSLPIERPKSVTTLALQQQFDGK